MDERLLAALANHRRPALVAIARIVTRIGSPLVMGLAVDVVTVRARDWRPAAVYLSGLLVRHRLAMVVARTRPPQQGWLEIPKGPSLPSRHTTVAVPGGLLIAEQLTGSPRVALGVPASLASAVGASRLYLGVHWPSDVAAGAAFAALWWAIFKRGRRRARGRGCTVLPPGVSR
ncbi:phosphatase PAP2 family protein [Streptosporangium sp. NPDC000396]|uniref:phosphatase PAP2 family protein n=1 Tax=Streptosporangium sp. NPDC000396 TaxID=3366185 RepID=UPI0036AEDC99